MYFVDFWVKMIVYYARPELAFKLGGINGGTKNDFEK